MNADTRQRRSWPLAFALLLLMSGAWLVVATPESPDTPEAPANQPDPAEMLTRAALTHVTQAQEALAQENYGTARSELVQAREALQAVVMKPKPEKPIAARTSD